MPFIDRGLRSLAVPTKRGWCSWRAPSPGALDVDAQGAVGSFAPACAGGGPFQSNPGGESHGATHSGRATVAALHGEVLPGTARSGISLMNLKIGDSETPNCFLTVGLLRGFPTVVELKCINVPIFRGQIP